MSIFGETENLTGHGPEQPAITTPDLRSRLDMMTLGVLPNLEDSTGVTSCPVLKSMALFIDIFVSFMATDKVKCLSEQDRASLIFIGHCYKDKVNI